jgi:hypothetical protein
VGGAGPAGQFTQLIVAAHPVEVTDPSEVNLNVRQPVAFAAVADIVPGFVVPENVPKTGAAVEFPS